MGVPTLGICNWQKWQSYRTDRGQPPWIKIHRRLLRCPEWLSLSDAGRAHLVSIWVLAADSEGRVPADPVLIKRLCYLDQSPDLDQLISLGFLEDDMGVTTPRRQDDASVTPACGQCDVPEAETEAKAEAEKTLMSGKPANGQARAAARAVLDLLNEKTGRAFKPVEANLKPIVARVKEYDADTVRQVTMFMIREWENDDKMASYLRPKTLYAASNFANYEGKLPNLEDQNA